MPAMTMGPPPAGSYNFVVRRSDIVAGVGAQPTIFLSAPRTHTIVLAAWGGKM